MDQMLKALFDELRADLRKELCEDIAKLLASKRRPTTPAQPLQATPPIGNAPNAEAAMEDMLSQRYDAFPKEIRQSLRAKYIPKQAGLLSKEQKVMIMKQCIKPTNVPDAPDAPDASDHTRAKVEPATEKVEVEVVPLTESEDEEEQGHDGHDKNDNDDKEKTPPLQINIADGFYMQCSQMPIEFGTQVQPPAMESGGWRKRRLPISSKAPPATPCSKRVSEYNKEKEKDGKDETDEPLAKKQKPQASSTTDFIQIDWEKILRK